MIVSDNYVVVKKLEEEKKEGFVTADVVDNFLYKGVVENIPEAPVYMGNDKLQVGDVIMFAKYSPDTHEIELEDVRYKFIHKNDILAVV